MAPGDAGAQRHEEEAVGALAGADPSFGQAAGADVVAEGDGDAAEPLGEQGPHRDVPPAEVGGVDGDAAVLVDDAGHGDPRGDGAGRRNVRRRLAELGGEAEHALHDRLRAALAAGGPACLVEQRAVRPDEGGFHPGAAHIKGDDVSHGNSFARSDHKRSSPLTVVLVSVHRMTAGACPSGAEGTGLPGEGRRWEEKVSGVDLVSERGDTRRHAGRGRSPRPRGYPVDEFRTKGGSSSAAAVCGPGGGGDGHRHDTDSHRLRRLR